MVRDPVCGMHVDEQHALNSPYAGRTSFFCSPYCQEQFDQQPHQYARRVPARHMHDAYQEAGEPKEEEQEPRTYHRQRQHANHSTRRR